MEIKIDLDMNQIDYDAINKQVQEKIAESYRIGSKIEYEVRKQVEQEVVRYFRNGAWGGLNNDSRREIQDEISKNIRELIAPHVANIFNQIPKEELDSIISDLLPKVLIELLTSSIRDTLTNYYYSSENRMMQYCEDRINEVLRR